MRGWGTSTGAERAASVRALSAFAAGATRGATAAPHAAGSVARAQCSEQCANLTLGETRQLFAFRHRHAVKRLERPYRAPTSLAAQKLCDRHRLSLRRWVEQYVRHIPLPAGDLMLELCARLPNTVGLLKRNEALALR